MGEVDEKEEILVSIHCCAYNHEKYIAQCLEGFIIQKTKFKFEAIVHDDASTDGTASLIKEYACKYPDIIIPIYQKENQYSKCKYNISKIMDECTRGKYIAICEGDDYWVDPYKLQKQVDLLEANPQYGLCYTKSKVYNQIKEKMEKTILGSENISFENIMLYGNGIPTLTTMFRKNLYFDYQNDVQPEKQNWLMGDLPMWLWFTANTQVGFIDEPTTVYRLLENSASHSNDIKKNEEFFSSSLNIRRFYLSKYSQYAYMSVDADNLYWRTMLPFGEKYNLREYSLNCLNHIIKKTFKEKIKYILYHTKFGFSIQTLFRKHRDE